MSPAAPAAYLDVAGVEKRFRDTVVLQHLDLGVGSGEFVSLLGPSGCGKTTLLRIIAGLLRADRGTVRLDGRDLTRVPAHKRNVGVVFQSYALFPHLTVAENVAFGLRARSAPAADIRDAVARVLALVQLTEYADRPIFVLSGGQQQRVAVARALAVRPSLLLLDEPLSALDRKLRETMQIELRHLLRRLGITAIFVTHDQDEALVMSDRIAVMNAGRIEHFGAPAEIYNRPATAFVLDFVGMSTRFAGVVRGMDGGEITVDTAVGLLRAPGQYPVGTHVLVAVRPERISLGRGDTGPRNQEEHANTEEGPGSPGALRRSGGMGAMSGPPSQNVVELAVRDPVFLGSKLILHFEVAADDRAVAELSSTTADKLAPGDRVPVHWSVADTMVFVR